jgi:hypothetical protein
VKRCKACGAALVRKESEASSDFARRLHCNYACGRVTAIAKIRGARAHNAVLTAPLVREIKLALDDGVPVKEIAAAHGVSNGAIYGIKCGYNWRHVD